ncbi:D-galactonate dehydratase [bacterium HR17]|uniref:D-galactonate dehydratase n=1 Tax=Candidatus Fervidibacter japonicus TaxID=2035412 RepID=A0A2H5XBI1_9BACT|nr:D-galactonate dehydratase [bacterium HR17]
MKITGVEVVQAGIYLLVKVATDEGVAGWGEGLPDHFRSVAAVIDESRRFLIGQDPLQVEHLWQTLFRGFFWKGGPIHCSAVSAIEMALWDIKGKVLGVPVYELLGGKVRERIRLYAHIGGATLDELKRSAERRLQQGFTAVKFCPVDPTRPLEGPALIRKAAERVKAVRDIVGWDNDVLLDLHGRTTPAVALLLAEEVAPYKPMWIEEPCQPLNVEALAEVAQKSPVPVATGERLCTRWQFREVLEKRAAAVLQPDPCVCGGIFELRKIAAMAEAYYVGVAPHNPYGPINTAAALQLAACIPNFVIQEHITLGEGYLRQPFEQVNGYVPVPEGVGLCAEPDEAQIAALPHSYREPPLVHYEDGAVGDW